MPLRAFFKRDNASSKSIKSSASGTRDDDDDYVSVPASLPYDAGHHNNASSSKLRIPLSGSVRNDPLLDPPPKKSALFAAYQNKNARSTRSLPDPTEGRPSPQIPPQPKRPPLKQKISVFSWGRQRSKSSSQTENESDDASFNLKSFRHVRPESPGPQLPPSQIESTAPPILPPIPIPTVPRSNSSFQVTSRKSRGGAPMAPSHSHSYPSPVSHASGTSTPTTPQQKMAAGAFRQAARRSVTSLADSPTISSTSPLDERPPSLLLLSPPAPSIDPRPGTPPRPPRAHPPNASPHMQGKGNLPPNTGPRSRSVNAFGSSSSSESSSQSEDEDGSSNDGLGRNATIKASSRQQTPVKAPDHRPIRPIRQQTAPSPVTLSSSAPSQQPSHSARPRPKVETSSGASPSLQSIHIPSVDASPISFTPRSSKLMEPVRRTDSPSKSQSPSARGANGPPSILKPSTLPAQAVRKNGARQAQSDTDEDEDDSESSSDEDAPLSKLLPRRAGASVPSLASPGRDSPQLRRPAASASPASRSSRTLVDLTAPSTLTGRPAAGPPLDRSQSDDRESVSSRQLIQRQQRQRASTLGSSSSSPLANSPQPSGRQPTGDYLPPPRPLGRRESPSSSTGDSSSGKAPLTPRDSDYGGSDVRRPEHGRKGSVTFEDDKGGRGSDARIRDRRRSEARAAIELGNVVNGPAPVDDEDADPAAAWRQSQLGIGNMSMYGNAPLNMSMSMPGMNFGSPAMGMGMLPPPSMQPFPAPMTPGGTPMYMFAHQQAMMAAKQAFQMSVAQQALSAAGDEWERGSAISGYWGGAQGGAQSMYAGSVGGAGGWGGSRSVYGGSFGPAMGPGAVPGSRMSSSFSQVNVPTGRGGGAGGNVSSGSRPRVPSQPAPKTSSGRGGRTPPGPPSSWK